MSKQDRWSKRTIPLPKDHGWKARAGYRIFVADRGLVRFDVPEAWIITPNEEAGSIVFHDREPPDDDCRLEMSLIRLPHGTDFSGLPLESMLRDAVMRQDEREIRWLPTLRRSAREDIEWVWAEGHFVDPVANRPALSRCLLARGPGVQTFITFDIWADDLTRFGPAWDEVLRSLQLGAHFPDPRHFDPQPPRHER